MQTRRPWSVGRSEFWRPKSWERCFAIEAYPETTRVFSMKAQTTVGGEAPVLRKGHGGDKIVGNDFEQLEAGPEGASPKDGASNNRSVQANT